MLRHVLLALLLVFGVSLQANAQSNKVSLFQSKYPTAKVRLDKQGKLITIRDAKAPIYAGTSIEAATAYLQEVSSVFDGESFGAPVVRQVAGRTIVVFTQVQGGVPVVGRGVSVTLQNNQPRNLSRFSQDLPARTQAELTPDFDETIARVLANEATQHSDAAQSHAKLVILPVGSSSVLAYSVFTREGLSLWKVYINAKTGAVLWKQDQLLNVKAKAFASNPGFNSASPTEEVELPTQLAPPSVDGGLQGDFVTAFSCAAPFDDPQTVCTPQGVALPDTNGDLLFDPVFASNAPTFNQDPFSQVHMFFHVDRIHSFFQALGATDEDGQITLPGGAKTNLDAPLLAITDLHFGETNNDDFDNAFFAGSAIVFGNGSSKDFSYDADVIYHEYGHAVISFVLEGFAIDELGLDTTNGAINEGSADIFSTLFTNDPQLGEFVQGNNGGLRNLDNARTFPNGLDGEVHDDGEIWGGTFWEIKTRFEEELTDDLGSEEATHNLVAQIYISAILGNPNSEAGFGELGLLVIDAAQDLGDASGVGAEASQIVEETFISRGILDPQGQPAQRIVSIDPPNTADAPSCLAFFGPGNFCQFAFGQARVGFEDEPVPGVLQYKVTIPPNKELKASVLASDFFGDSNFEFYINEGSPVTFTYDFIPNFNVIVTATETLQSPETIEIQNLTDQPKTFFMAFGMLIPDNNGFGVFASLSDIVIQDPTQEPPPLETFFSGGSCNVSQDKTPVVVLLLFALTGLYFISSRRKTIR